MALLFPMLGCGLAFSSQPLRRTTLSRTTPATCCTTATAAQIDVVEATKEFLASSTGYYSPVAPDALDDAFVFRAPSIGPLNKRDYIFTMTNLQTYVGYPDIKPNAFGFTIDPADPLKCIFWTRATGTFSAPWNPFGKRAEQLPFAKIQPNNKKAQLPTECYSITFTPEGKARYLTAGYVVNRFEGNTGGLGAVLALFNNAGLPQMASLALNDKVKSSVNWLSNNVDDSIAKTRSNPEDLPAWYSE